MLEMQGKMAAGAVGRDGQRAAERTRRGDARVAWHGAAFIVEALLLLVFLMGSLAVIMSLNAAAKNVGGQSVQLLAAVDMAANAAEDFAAAPDAAAESAGLLVVGEVDEADEAGDDIYGEITYADDGGLVLVREVSVEAVEAGTMYRAVISVWSSDDVSISVLDGGAASADAMGTDGDTAYKITLANREAEPVYQLETSAYVSGGTSAQNSTRDSEV